MVLEKCPLCGSSDFFEKIEVKDFSVSKEVFKIVECSACLLLFTNPRPANEDIGEYYKSESYISHTNQKTGLFGKIYQVLRNRALTKKLYWIKKHSAGKTILDYGSGTGEFLNYCVNQGYCATGVEIADEPREKAISSYGLNVLAPNELESLENDFFDIASMWHVLEHVDQLVPSIKNIASKIKRNGILVLALPNPNSWDAKKYKQFWAAWDVPIHFYHFKKTNIEKLAATIGFDLVETINMPYDSYYISLLSEEYKSGKKKWINAVFNGWYSNFKAGKDNASSLTYILRKL